MKIIKLFVGGIICLILSKTTSLQVNNINAFVKPAKFFLSTWILCFTIGWIGYELHQPNAIKLYNIVTIVVMSFELIVITWQAANGRLSHFNADKPSYSILFSLMGLAITIFTLHTAYLGYLFFKIKSVHFLRSVSVQTAITFTSLLLIFVYSSYKTGTSFLQ